MTLAELKIMVENLLDLDTNSDLTDLTVVIGANNYLKAYIPLEQRVFPQNGQLEDTITIDENGYTLSALTNLGNTDIGFKLWKTEIAKGNKLIKTKEGSSIYGYYIKSGKLYVTGATSTATTFVVQYQPKVTRYSISTLPDFDNTVLPIFNGAEHGAELMICSRYMERDQSEPQKVVNYRNDSLNEISTFFATNAGMATFSM